MSSCKSQRLAWSEPKPGAKTRSQPVFFIEPESDFEPRKTIFYYTRSCIRNQKKNTQGSSPLNNLGLENRHQPFFFKNERMKLGMHWTELERNFERTEEGTRKEFTEEAEIGI